MIFIGGEGHLGSLFKYEGDSPEEKIVHAFLSLGVKAFEKLEHDFLLVLQTKDCTYLVRDRFGVQSLYFKVFQSKLLYSSFLRDLYQGESIDVSSVEEYIRFSTTSEQQGDSRTYFKGIYQVPPSCYLCFKKDSSFYLSVYWRPKFCAFNVRTVTEEFKSSFFDSVKGAVEGYEQVGCQLSGGLDSSIVALAYYRLSNRSFPTYYVDTGNRLQRDSYYALLVSNTISSDHSYVIPDLSSVYDSIRRVSRETGSPVMMILPPNFHESVAQAGNSAGIRGILTGIDGDSVVGHGYNYIRRLRKDREWEVLLEEYLNYRKKEEGLTVREIQNSIIESELNSLLKSREFREAVRLLRVVYNKWGYVPYSYIKHLIGVIVRRLNRKEDQAELWIERDYRKDILPNELYEFTDEEFKANFLAVVNAEYPRFFEELKVIGKRYNIDFLHPFFDQKVFEVALSVPDSVRYGHGMTRWLLRESMRDIYPKEILERQDKDEFSPFAYNSCLMLWTSHREFFEYHPTLWTYIDKATFLKCISNLASLDEYDPSTRVLSRRLNRVLYLGIWLDTI